MPQLCRGKKKEFFLFMKNVIQTGMIHRPWQGSSWHLFGCHIILICHSIYLHVIFIHELFWLKNLFFTSTLATGLRAMFLRHLSLIYDENCCILYFLWLPLFIWLKSIDFFYEWFILTFLLKPPSRITNNLPQIFFLSFPFLSSSLFFHSLSHTQSVIEFCDFFQQSHV